jgi:hypothetical protein
MDPSPSATWTESSPHHEGGALGVVFARSGEDVLSRLEEEYGRLREEK